jgi:hypothetical protein
MPHVRWLLVLLATGSSALAAGCGGSGYQYVENGELGVYAKVPDDWTMYDEEDLLVVLAASEEEAAAEEAPTELNLQSITDRMWFRGFDGGEDPDRAEMLQFTGSEPRGAVMVQQLTVAQREQMNVMGMRGFSPLDMRPETTGRFRLLDENAVEFDGGYHGIHTVYAEQLEDGLAIVDQTILLDATSSTLYRFVVGCNQDCYMETHTDEIQAIVDSWTIQEGG